MFIGRKEELELLRSFKKRKIAGLIVCSGRRRIGKSTLIEHFSEGSKFLEFYGLAPRKNLTNQDQLKHFGRLIGEKFGIPPVVFHDWHHGLTTLANLTAKGPVIIFLDEISWMANKDKDFVGILKGIWDTQFKKNKDLLLVLCGSVSSWIEDNILNDKGFMGRVSLTINLEEMPLSDANKFWKNTMVSASEKFKLLAVTGGIPRYLEEIEINHTAEQNIKRMAFTKGGILVNEFEKIFRDIFEKKADDYKKIVQALCEGELQLSELCKKLGVTQTGAISNKLNVLKQSGFISKDYVWNKDLKSIKLFKYRLKDNYLRFYLKYIDPKKNLINQGLYKELYLEELSEWSTIMGLQFENLVLNNLPSIQKILDIPSSTILSASPYFQKKTLRKEPCQIDLLIQTKHTIYVCEIKFSKNICYSIIAEMKEKIRKLKIPKEISIRPILIYQGELSPKVNRENFFSNIISFDQLL